MSALNLLAVSAFELFAIGFLMLCGMGVGYLIKFRFAKSDPLPGKEAQNAKMVDCPECLKQFMIPPNLSGKKVKCNQCGAEFLA